jgi:hypothetical protein
MNTSITPAAIVPFTPPVKTVQTATPATTSSYSPAIAPVTADTQTPAPVTGASSGNGSATSDTQREAAVRQAALSFKNFYAVSDQEFSIFKDATGKYITRYVSLRDGSITYLPEPTLVKQAAQASGTPIPAQVAINA